MNAVSLESGNAEELYICRPVYYKSFTDLPSDQGLRMASLNVNGSSIGGLVADKNTVYIAVCRRYTPFTTTNQNREQHLLFSSPAQTCPMTSPIVCNS